ncbi:MAG: NAD(+) diphosphatase [Polyangiaceae bacterium]
MDAPRFVPGHLPEPTTGDAFWAPFRKSELLVKSLADKRARLLRTDDVKALGLAVTHVHHVGTLEGVPCIAAALPDDAPDVEGCRYGGLRQAYGWLPKSELEAAMTGFQIQYWDSHHRFCPGCGAPIAMKKAERAKRCEPCARDFYPPVVPAVIVRVRRGDALLMTRAPHFPSKMYGLVAGFLEPGETLEQCVAREIREETGLVVRDVRYFGSQPWPFPHQVMVGFTAEYESGDIVVDKTELEEAAWFTREAMPQLPPPFSIARALIDDWLRSGE